MELSTLSQPSFTQNLLLNQNISRKFENLPGNTLEVALKVNILYKTFMRTLKLKGLNGFDFCTSEIKLFANIVNISLIMNTFYSKNQLFA